MSNIPQSEECPTCQGVGGWLVHRSSACTVCWGTGKDSSGDKCTMCEYGVVYTQEWVICDECGGTGEV